MYRAHKEDDTYHGPVRIGTLFEKYRQRLRPPQGIVITAFCAVATAELGVPLAPTAVRYNSHSRILSITSSGPHKTELLLRKAQILAECRQTLGEHGAPQYIV